MASPGEHKTVQSRILAYAQAIPGNRSPRGRLMKVLLMADRGSKLSSVDDMTQLLFLYRNILRIICKNGVYSLFMTSSSLKIIVVLYSH